VGVFPHSTFFLTIPGKVSELISEPEWAIVFRSFECGLFLELMRRSDGGF
jgi:hypothetical protein